ncbi:serine protease [Hyphomicrobium sp. ghe19]|uniref:S1 family peptidase n=1 Tax=Hyphomicrobium sp. ghe19 TaxID=2682968 RepID=UPI001366C1D9|nr:hypothetical protein HYPP_00122 [Hyphomicrobium sp. ghe19]
MAIAEQMLHSTVKLVSMKGGAACSTGTGFFMNFAIRGESSVPAIVTNKHVIEGSDQVTALCHLADDGKPSGKFIACGMPTTRNCVFHHPDANVDLCAVPIGNIMQAAIALKTPLFITHLALDLIPDDEDWKYFDAIEEVTMIGCPNGLSDEANNLPIVRRGITATSLGKLYNGKPEFMVDMACFPGSSGSPCFCMIGPGISTAKRTACMSREQPMKFPPGHYDEKQVRALTKLLDDVCADLRISPDNQPKREWVAMVMLVCSNRAPADIQELRAEIARQFLLLESLESQTVEG